MHNQEKIKTYKTSDMYKSFTEHKLSPKEFNSIVRTYFGLMIESTQETGVHYRLPLRLGTFGVSKTKNTKKHYPDWDYYNRTGEIRMLKNNHSHGYYAFFNWGKKDMKYIVHRKKALFKFVPARQHKKGLSKAIIDRNTIVKYYE